MTSNTHNAGQADHWGGVEGDHWARHAQRHDGMLAPFADRLASVARFDSHERVLDLGCGCGITTIDAATAVGSEGAAMGVDLSPQMNQVAVARADAAGVADWTSFQVLDAQTADLGEAQWDVALSRFGVMFFDDPVAAFANIARALRPSGRMAFCCWQGIEANDWMLIPGLAAAEHVALPELASGDQPGPFAFADPDRVRSILVEAGFDDVEVESFTTPVLLAGGGSMDDTMEYLLTSGLARALFENAAEPDRIAAVDAVREALEPLHDGQGVRLGAAAWMVTAHAP